MNYHRLYEDISFPERWYLGDLNIDIEEVWRLTDGKVVDKEKYRNLEIEVDQGGVPLDFTETDADNIPIVSEAFAQCIYHMMEEVDLIPITIPNTYSNYYVMVVKKI